MKTEEKDPAIVYMDDSMGSRSLRHINIIRDAHGRLHKFTGESIPGVVAVLRHEYHKQGKWSHNTWHCRLAPGATMIVEEQGWNTRDYFPEDTSVEEVAARWEVEESVARAFLSIHMPRSLERFDKIAADIAALSAPAPLSPFGKSLAGVAKDAGGMVAEFHNLTPHPITFRDAEGNDTTFQVSPAGIARVATREVPVVAPAIGAAIRREWGAVECPSFGDGEGVEIDGKRAVLALIVSSIVLDQAVAQGHRLAPFMVAPDSGPTAIREEGRVVAVTRWVLPPNSAHAG